MYYEMSWYQVDTAQLVRGELVPVPSRDNEMSWYQGILPSWYEMSWYRYQVETTKLVGTKWHCQLVRNELVPVPSRDDEMSWYQVALPSWYEMSWYQVGYR